MHNLHIDAIENDADDAKAALKSAAKQLPLDIAPDVDLVELRIAVDPDARSYVDEELV